MRPPKNVIWSLCTKEALNGLLAVPKSRGKKYNILFCIDKFEGSEFNSKVLDQVSIELKKQDQVDFTFNFFWKKTLHLLQSLVDVAPKS